MDFEVPHFFPSECSMEDEMVFTAVGRALTVAIRYEANCNALAFLIDCKLDADYFANPEFSRRVKDLVNRTLHKKIGRVAYRYNMASGPEKTLREAKDARNFIAHELTRGISESLCQPKGRENLMLEIRGSVFKVAVGDCLICDLICIETGNTPMMGKSVKEYPHHVTDWVVGS